MKIRPFASIAFLAPFLYSLHANATTFTWNAGVNTNWDSITANWTGATWANATTNDAVFGASGVGTVSLTEAITTNKITFNIAGYTLSGNTISIGGSAPAILANESATVNTDVTLSAAQTWTVASGKNLTLGGTVDKGANALTITGAGAVEFTSGLGGTGGLYLNGGSNVNYSATGGTTSDFRIGNNTAGATNSFTIGGGDLTVANSLSFSSAAGSTGNFNQTGGTVTLSGGLRAANQTGAISNLDLSGGTFTSTADIFVLNQRGNTTLTVRGAVSATVNGVAVSGWTANTSSTIVNLDGGTLTTDGFWELNSSPVNIAANASCTSTVNFNGSLIKARSVTTNFLGGTVNNAVVKEGGAKIDTNGVIDVNGDSITIAKGLTHGGAAATDGGLTKSGVGKLTLSGANTYTGPTTVNQGTLTLAATGSISSSPTITVASGAILDVGTAKDLASGQTLAGSGTLQGNLNAKAGSTVSPGIGGIGNLNVEGSLSLAGSTTMDLNKSGATITSDQITGAGSVTLGGTLTFQATGVTLEANDQIQVLTNTGGVTGEFLSISIVPALPVGLSFDSSTLLTDGKIRVVNRLSSPLISPPGGSYVGAQAVTVSSDSGTTIFYTLDGSDPTNSPTSGPGPITLTVPTNSYQYTIRAVAKKSGQPNSLISSAVYNTVNTPTWITNQDGFFWSNLVGDELNWQNDVIAGGAGVTADFSTLALTQDTSVALDGSRSIGTMKFGDASANPQFNWALAATSGSVLTLDGGASQPVIQVNNQSVTVSGILGGAQGLSKSGSGTLKFAAANTYSGNTLVNAGILELVQDGSINSASGINLAAGTLLRITTPSGARTVGNALGGAGNIQLSTGTAPTGNNGTDVTLSGGFSSFTGQLTLDNTRMISVQSIPGLSSVDLVINDGCQIFANDGGNANFTANSITIAGRGHNAGGGTGPLGAMRIDNNHHYTGAVILAGNAAISNATFTGDSYVDGNISGNYELEILPRYGNWNTKVYLAGNNTYGSTRVTGGAVAPYNGGIGELIANSATGLSSGPVVVDGGRLSINGYSFSIANLSSTASGGTVQNSHATTNSTLTVGTDGTSTTYGGTLINGAAASLALTKTGAGTLTLGGANTYSGATTVNAGALLVNGSLAAGSAVTVNNTAILGGTGSVNGPVNVAATANVAPGNGSTGTLATGNVTLAGTYTCEINAANGDRLNVAGNLALTGATLNVQVLAGGFTQAHYVIASYTTRTGTLQAPVGYAVQYDKGAGSNEIWLVQAGGGYSGWASANGVTGGLNADFDNDGVSNGIEYFMGQPGTGFTAMPSVVSTAGVRSITWIKGNDYTGTYNTDFVVETSATLNSDWVQESVGGTVTVTGNQVIYTFPAGSNKKFARLKVTGP